MGGLNKLQMSTFKFPEIVAEMRSYWLMGQTGGMLLNGHWGYVEIAPESTADLLIVEFTPLTILPGFNSN